MIFMACLFGRKLVKSACLTKETMSAVIARTSQDQGVGLFVVQQPLTKATAAQILHRNHSWLVEEARVAGQVVDYSHTVTDLDARPLCKVALEIVRHGIEPGSRGLSTPTALVVNADQLEMWQRYAVMMCRVGIPRAAFASASMARQWAAANAALWAAQHQFRTRAG